MIGSGLKPNSNYMSILNRSGNKYYSDSFQQILNNLDNKRKYCKANDKFLNYLFV